MTSAAEIYRAWQDTQRETGGNAVAAFAELLRENPGRRAQLFRIAAQDRAQGRPA